jgi:hypothetical protein
VLHQTPKELVGTAGGVFNIPHAQLSQLLTHTFHESIGVSMGVEGRGGVRGLERHHGKVNNGGGKRQRVSAAMLVAPRGRRLKPCSSCVRKSEQGHQT